jgi:hypothetical protein
MTGTFLGRHLRNVQNPSRLARIGKREMDKDRQRQTKPGSRAHQHGTLESRPMVRCLMFFCPVFVVLIVEVVEVVEVQKMGQSPLSYTLERGSE